MGTTKVSDVMSFFGGTQRTGELAAPNASDDTFSKMINDATMKSGVNVADSTSTMLKNNAVAGNNASDNSIKPAQDVKGTEVKTDVTRSDNAGSDDTAKVEVESDKVNDTADNEDVKKELGEVANEVKDAIKDRLGISDEDIENAMAVLGLNMIDLLDPENIKSLMLELSGQEDSISLLTNETLLNDIVEVTGVLTDALEVISEEYELTDEQMQQVINQLVENEEPVITEAVVPNVTADEAKEDDTKLRIDVTREDNNPSLNELTKEPTYEGVQLERKAANLKDGESNESNMSNQMFSQEFSSNTDMAATSAEAVAEYSNMVEQQEEILRQVTDHIKLNISADTTSMEMQLHPASLGTVNLQIASQGGTVTAHLLVQNEAVKSVLEGQLVQLLQTFEEQGQKVEAIEVSVAGYDLDRSLNQNNNQQNSDGSKDDRTSAIGRVSRRRLNLNDLTEDEMAELSEEEQLAAEMMEANGTSVDYMA